jgi:hypothetical protein
MRKQIAVGRLLDRYIEGFCTCTDHMYVYIHLSILIPTFIHLYQTLNIVKAVIVILMQFGHLQYYFDHF